MLMASSGPVKRRRTPVTLCVGHHRAIKVNQAPERGLLS